MTLAYISYNFDNRKTQSNIKRQYLYLPLATGFLTPSLVIFFLQVLIAKMSPLKSVLDILHKQFAEGYNFFILMVWSFIPFGALILLIYVLDRKVESKRLACIFWGGFIAVSGFTLFSHISVWYPLYSGGHFSSTSGMAFCILPILCIGIMGIGMLTGWGISFLPFFKSGSIDN